MRGEDSMVSLQDASRRLQLPIDTLWRWVKDGKLKAEAKPGRGHGIEFYLTREQLEHARDLRAEAFPDFDGQWDSIEEEPRLDNVISVDFKESTVGSPPPAATFTPRSSSVAALGSLRADALGAIERQAGRNASITELVSAVEHVMNSVLEAMDRAQDLHEGRLTAELEALRVRLARQIQDSEREDLRLHDELSETREQLKRALEMVTPEFTTALAAGSRSESVINAEGVMRQTGDVSSG